MAEACTNMPPLTFRVLAASRPCVRECAAQAEAKGLKEDESQRKERRRVDKFITLQVQQISATQQQAGYHSLTLMLPSSCCCPRTDWRVLCAHSRAV